MCPAHHHTYFLYGLQIASDRDLPGLRKSVCNGRPDVWLSMAGEQQSMSPDEAPTILYASPEKDEQGESYFQLLRSGRDDTTRYSILWADGTAFVQHTINFDGSRVECNWAQVPVTDTIPFLLGLVAGGLLRLRGLTCLHASAVGISGRAVIILGAQGAGKSTLAAALIGRGHAFLCDDLVPLLESDSGFLVQPGYPRMRLWPSSALALPGLQVEALPRVMSEAEKRFLDLDTEIGKDGDGYRFQPDPLPLAAVYWLDPPDKTAGAAHSETVPLAKSTVMLMAHRYGGKFLDKEGHRRDLERLGAVAQQVPVRKLNRPPGLDILGQTCAVLEQEIKSPNVGE